MNALLLVAFVAPLAYLLGYERGHRKGYGRGAEAQGRYDAKREALARRLAWQARDN